MAPSRYSANSYSLKETVSATGELLLNTSLLLDILGLTRATADTTNSGAFSREFEVDDCLSYQTALVRM